MRKQSTLIFGVLLLIGDFIAVLTAFVLAYIFRVKIDPRPIITPIAPYDYLQLFLLLAPFWLILFSSLGLYRKEIWNVWLKEAWLLLVGSFAGILFIIGYDFISVKPVFPARLVAVYALALGFSLLLIERALQRLLRKTALRFGIGKQRVMLIGDSELTASLGKELMTHPLSGYHVSAVIAGREHLPKGFGGRVFYSLERGLSALDDLNVESIIQTQLSPLKKDNEAIVAEATKRHLEYRFVPEQSATLTAHSELELFAGFPMLTLHQTRLIGWGRVLKRGFDFIVGTLLIILLSPVMLVIAIIIKLKDPGPILFRQKRLTRYAQEIHVLKFRTMKREYSGRDPEDVFTEMGRPELAQEYKENRAKVANDPRVSKVGRWLRAHSLDELPQLFNVITGTISLVGPRAIPREEIAYFRDKGPLVLNVKTGITGLAQVSGRSDISIEERLRLDLYYVQNWSIWLDIKILFKTIWVVLRRSGAA